MYSHAGKAVTQYRTSFILALHICTLLCGKMTLLLLVQKLD